MAGPCDLSPTVGETAGVPGAQGESHGGRRTVGLAGTAGWGKACMSSGSWWSQPHTFWLIVGAGVPQKGWDGPRCLQRHGNPQVLSSSEPVAPSPASWLWMAKQLDGTGGQMAWGPFSK